MSETTSENSETGLPPSLERLLRLACRADLASGHLQETKGKAVVLPGGSIHALVNLMAATRPS